MTVEVEVRVPAPSGGKFLAGSWDRTVGKPVPVRVLDPSAQDGSRIDYDSYCTEAHIDSNGKSVTLKLNVYATSDPMLVDGLLIRGAEIVARRVLP